MYTMLVRSERRGSSFTLSGVIPLLVSLLSSGSSVPGVHCSQLGGWVEHRRREHGLTYTISMVALSVQLPSPVVGPVTVTLGE